jgi:hypothetical protein
LGFLPHFPDGLYLNRMQFNSRHDDASWPRPSAPVDSRAAIGRNVAREAVPNPVHPTRLLDVDMDQFAGIFGLITKHRGPPEPDPAIGRAD